MQIRETGENDKPDEEASSSAGGRLVGADELDRSTSTDAITMPSVANVVRSSMPISSAVPVP